MLPENDSASISPGQRFHEIAGILAIGVLRLRARAALPNDSDEHNSQKNCPDSDSEDLELLA